MNRRLDHAVPTARIDGRGSFVIPARLRRVLGMDAGSLLMLEVRDGALVVRPAVAVPVESLRTQSAAMATAVSPGNPASLAFSDTQAPAGRIRPAV
jgi:AbrB family looped-hinge helix DNA binding protein